MSTHPISQRGAAALPITLMLSFVLLLGVAVANRSVLFEVRSAIHEVRSAQAHEAAQAGLSWTLAQLNRGTPIGEDCQAAGDVATRWAQRLSLGPLQASCVSSGSGWSCHCPGSGDARSVSTDTSPAFSIHLEPEPAQAGRWRLIATGHSGFNGATARLQVQVGRLPALDTLPAAALTVRGDATLGAGLAVTHADPASGGVTVHAGGAVNGIGVELRSTPGTPAQASVVGLDSALSALTGDGLHASVFRLDTPAWREQPGARDVNCTSACDTALLEALRQRSLVRLVGGLSLTTPLTLGSPERPVVLVVEGPVALQAEVVIHGLVYARHPQWADTAGATVHGAVIAEGDLQTQGRTQIHHNATVLQTLHRQTGTYAPLANSWLEL